jgi:hypothetical protein
MKILDNVERLECTGPNSLLVCGYDVNLMDGNMCFIKKAAEPALGVHEYMRVLNLKTRKLTRSHIDAQSSECSM